MTSVTWTRSQSEIKAKWQMSPGARFAMGYSGSVPGLESDLTGEASIPFSGTGMVELRLALPGQEVTHHYLQVSGGAPARASSVMYKNLTEDSLLLSWGTKDSLSGTTGWMVAADIDGEEAVLSLAPSNATSQAIVLSGLVGRISRLRVYGIGHGSVRSEPSPDLSFNGMSGGPTILIGDFSVSSTSLSVSWQVGSYDVIRKITYKLTGSSPEDVRASGGALPVDTLSIAVVDYVGPLTLVIEAQDAFGRSSVEHKSIYVYNVAPLPPEILIEEVGLEFIRVRVVPNSLSSTPTQSVIISGAGRQETLTSPFIKEFTQLRQGTEYYFDAIAVNPTGLRSGYAETAFASTIRLPMPDTSSVSSNYYGGPILPYLHSMLTSDLRHYVLQLYTDTRIRDEYREQIIYPPPGFNALMEFMMKVGNDFGSAIRAEASDEESLRASLTIDKTGDVLEKLAIYVERIEYGSIWNPG